MCEAGLILPPQCFLQEPRAGWVHDLRYSACGSIVIAGYGLQWAPTRCNRGRRAGDPVGESRGSAPTRHTEGDFSDIAGTPLPRIPGRLERRSTEVIALQEQSCICRSPDCIQKGWVRK